MDHVIIKEVDLLLVGKTGNGKSSTGNSILKRNIFESSPSATSVTTQIQVQYGTYKDRTIKVVDGPGVGGTELSEVEATKEITNAISIAIAANPQGYHAVLLVVRYGVRFAKEDDTTIKVLRNVFGKDFVKQFCVLVVTCGDNFNSFDDYRLTFEQWCSQQDKHFRDLIVECGNRVVLFDNKTEDVDKQNSQLDRLLEIVDMLGSSGQRYTDKNFELARKKRDALLVDANKIIIGEESMREASLILQELGKIFFDEPDRWLSHLDNLQKRADDLLESITRQDNNTGVLQTVIQNARHIKETVDFQKSRARSAIDIQNKKRQLQEEMENLRQEKVKHEHELEEFEKKKLQDMIQVLEDKCQKQREKIESMKAETRSNLSIVEGENVSVSTNTYLSDNFNTIVKHVIENLIPLLLRVLLKK